MEKTRIQQRREELGWSKQKLADLVGCSRVAISQYEARKRRPTGDILVRLAAVLGVSSAWLAEATDDPEPKDNLPREWEEVVNEAISHGLTPQDVHVAIQILIAAKRQTGAVHGNSVDRDETDLSSAETVVRAENR